MLNRLLEEPRSLSPAVSWSGRAEDRLLLGETVPWSQIPQDHLLLGSMTATELIEAGIVQVNPAFIGGPAITHVGLTLRSRENGEGEWRSPVATAGGAWLLASG